ncbi:MAG: bifunctional oligoribonuclease/PAP phosphatase NrnA [candidate division KSB1 bacterium]|nr:bifunctional oligoribonuclease/PAP phosphatase NrnA [candidate division KSB1 bacterium]MDZ7319004.1 bifunctional oligoribonuclease/PAP phosphatase NrnA [candidate division KSB1 bacterium]MDZ7342016.1 bifunctional oligoribonuclease/PAP phosphatase NrnA [candidate division KSB1 bacterium]
MISNIELQKINDLISSHRKFILTTHINPDGDAIGSEMAMADYLRHLGKSVTIINNTPTPNNYHFLDENEEILVYDPDHHYGLAAAADAYIILDISDWERLRKIGQIIKASSAPKLCIDHHHINYQFVDVDIIHEEASSTGEIVFDFLNKNHYPLNPVTARALYTCILTDTGSFRFSNTSARTHTMAAQLLTAGINAREIYSLVYENNSPGKMKLMGEALRNLHFEHEGQLAWFVLTQEMFRACQTTHWDTEGFAELPRSIEGVEVSLMFTELDDTKVKVSLRSKGNLVINHVAEKLGGGGHQFAAGALVNRHLVETIPMVLAEIDQLVFVDHTKKTIEPAVFQPTEKSARM